MKRVISTKDDHQIIVGRQSLSSTQRMDPEIQPFKRRIFPTKHVIQSKVESV